MRAKSYSTKMRNHNQKIVSSAKTMLSYLNCYRVANWIFVRIQVIQCKWKIKWNHGFTRFFSNSGHYPNSGCKNLRAQIYYFLYQIKKLAWNNSIDLVRSLELELELTICDCFCQSKTKLKSQFKDFLFNNTQYR